MVKPPGMPSMTEIALVIHAANVDDRRRPFLFLCEINGTLRVYGELFLNERGLHLLSDEQSDRNP